MSTGLCKWCGGSFYESYPGARGVDLCDRCYDDDAKRPAPYGSKEAELRRTAEMLPGICDRQGVYYALAFLLDSGYDHTLMRMVLTRLADVPGAKKV